MEEQLSAVHKCNMVVCLCSVYTLQPTDKDGCIKFAMFQSIKAKIDDSPLGLLCLLQ